MPIYPSSGVAVDNETIETNASGEIAAKPSVITQSSSLNDITYSTNTTLSADVYANNVTINSGVTVTTNGYNFYCLGTFTNNGTISTGTGYAGGTAGTSGVAGGNGSGSTVSYGGSGGGGGGGGTYGGGNGGATVNSGGAGGGANTSGSPGSTPTAPTLSATLISTWYKNGIKSYLIGGSGGGGGDGGAGAGGASGAGLYIQANQITAGTINSSGTAGGNGLSTNGAGGGGGGSGSILLAYGAGGYTAGTYTTSGGAGGTGVTYPNGGAGGGGNIMVFAGNPIAVGNFIYSSATNSINNRTSQYNYTTQSTSTSAIIASQNFTPSTSGLVSIRATVSASNNTIGGTAQLQIQNGSTNLSTSQIFTQESLAGNPFTITLYTEQLFTSPFSAQTYNINLIATGGTASAVIQEFTIEEVY